MSVIGARGMRDVESRVAGKRAREMRGERRELR
jgi:hypothetical protein